MTMTMAIILVVIALLCLAVSVACFIWHTHRKAERYRKAFEPRPQSPHSRDLAYWQKRLVDREIELHQHAHESEASRASDQKVSFLLKRQAG